MLSNVLIWNEICSEFIKIFNGKEMSDEAFIHLTSQQHQIMENYDINEQIISSNIRACIIKRGIIIMREKLKEHVDSNKSNIFIRELLNSWDIILNSFLPRVSLIFYSLKKNLTNISYYTMKLFATDILLNSVNEMEAAVPYATAEERTELRRMLVILHDELNILEFQNYYENILILLEDMCKAETSRAQSDVKHKGITPTNKSDAIK